MTKLNLMATLTLVDRANAMESDLLKYATSPHGGKVEAPLKRGDEAAVESLIEWIKVVAQQTAVEDSITLTELPDIPGENLPLITAKPSTDHSQSMTGQVRHVTYLDGEIPLGFDALAKKPLNLDSESKADRNRPIRLPTVENPFDPEIFNRYYREGAIANSRDR
jgi:hypothetical protein